MVEIPIPLLRGHFISTRRDGQGKQYVVINENRSMVYAPVSVKPNTRYRIVFEMRKEGPEAKVFCNIYSNKNFDFEQVLLSCESNDWVFMEFKVSTGNFPISMPMSLRIWKKPDSKGKIHIKRIIFEEHTLQLDGGDEKPIIVAKTASASSANDVKKDRQSQKNQNRQTAIDKIKNKRTRRQQPPPKLIRQDENMISSTYSFKEHSRVLFLSETAEISKSESLFKNSGFVPYYLYLNKNIDIKKEFPSLKPRDWVCICLDYSNSCLRENDIDFIAHSFPNVLITLWSKNPETNRFKIFSEYGDYVFSPSGNNNTLPLDLSKSESFKTLSNFVGFKYFLEPEVKKYRVLNDCKRAVVLSKEIKDFLKGGQVKNIRYESFGKIKLFLCDYQPDWVHIIMDEDNKIPWEYILLDIRRKLPNTIISLSHSFSEYDLRVRQLSMLTDFLITHDKNAAQIYNNERIRTDVRNKLTSLNDFNSLRNWIVETRKGRILDQYNKPVDLTVIIGTYNRLNQLKSAVESSIQASNSLNVEIILNDAGSTDGTIEWIKERVKTDGRIKAIYSGKRTSFTEAFNDSLRIAAGNLVIWMSDDIIAMPAAFYNMYKQMLQTNVSPFDMGAFMVRNSWAGPGFEVRSYNGLLLPTVGCMFTETLLRYSGINSDYPFYAQDTELDYRVLRLGGKIIQTKNAKLSHVCAADEFRKNNIKRHEQLRLGDKIELVSENFRPKTSNFGFPKILLTTTGVGADKIFSTVNTVRAHLRNSHWFLEKDIYEKLYIPEEFSFIMPAPRKTRSKFDLVIEINLNGALVVQPESALRNNYGKSVGL